MSRFSLLALVLALQLSLLPGLASAEESTRYEEDQSTLTFILGFTSLDMGSQTVNVAANASEAAIGSVFMGAGTVLIAISISKMCRFELTRCKVARQDAAEFLAQDDGANPSPVLAEVMEKVRDDIRKERGEAALAKITDEEIAGILVASK